jgi:hypothetical protein
MTTIPIIDFDAHYMVEGYGKIAWYLLGYVTTTVEVHDGFSENQYADYELEEIEDRDVVRAVMVGDDREHWIGVEDLILLDEDNYCSCCGQVGCPW